MPFFDPDTNMLFLAGKVYTTLKYIFFMYESIFKGLLSSNQVILNLLQFIFGWY